MKLGQAQNFAQAVAEAARRLPVVYVHPTSANGDPLPVSGLSLGARIMPESILARCGVAECGVHAGGLPVFRGGERCERD
jgi:lysozyme